MAPEACVPMETDDEHYHSGGVFDEVAALASLVLNARIVAGPVDRTFSPGEDPLGNARRPAELVARHGNVGDGTRGTGLLRSGDRLSPACRTVLATEHRWHPVVTAGGGG